MCDPHASNLKWASLPTEILINIFQHLELYDLQSVKLCCKQWFAVTLCPEFDTRGVFKIRYGVLDSNHPIAEVLLRKRILNLYLKGVFIGEADELFNHIGDSVKALTLKLVPIDNAMHFTIKYFPNLRYLKVTNIKLSSLVANVSWISPGSLLEMQEVILLANDSTVNKYILNSVDGAKSLKKLTIEFNSTDEGYILRVIKKHLHCLEKLDLRYYKEMVLNHLKWEELLKVLKLTNLSLQGHFHPDIINCAIKTQEKLQSLDLKGSVCVDDNYLFQIGRKLRELKRLNLQHCGRITNRGVNQLATLSELEILDLTGCNKLACLSVHAVIGSRPNWSILELHLQDVNIDESDVCFCANNLPNLRVFNLIGCRQAVTDKSIQEIFDCQRKLQSLKVDHCKISDDGIIGLATGSSIQNLQFLEILSLRCCKGLTDVTLISGLKMPSLKILDISNCDKMTTAGLKSLVKNCPTIEEMYITSGRNMDRGSVKILTTGLGRLRLLTVENCHDLMQISAANWIQTKFRPITNEVTLKKQFLKI